MKQNEFFNILMDGLKDFPETKLQDIIFYYENKFSTGLISGITEEEIISELDNPYLIVEKYRNEDSNTNTSSETLTKDHSKDIDNKYNNNLSIDLKNDDNFYVNSDDFYDLNASSNSQENNYIPASSTEANYSFKSENNSSSNINNHSNENSKTKAFPSNVNNILKFCIVGLTLIIFFPVITGILGFILSLFGVTIGILVGSIGLLVGGTFTSFIGVPNLPMFVANFPYPVLVLFSLGSITLSILLTLVFYYLCKFLVKSLIRAYNLLKSKGGAL